MADLRQAVSWLIGVGCLGAAAPGAGTDALLIQQTAPWGHDAWGPELAARGLTSDTADASAPQTVDLTPYSLVIVAGDQDDELLQALHDRQRDLVEWVGGG
ncbi:MAG: hypothetical protein QGH45_23390, partial [Myxococcota bacterium]|nr:hypothetical protein [Myxococcota bacterium]